MNHFNVLSSVVLLMVGVWATFRFLQKSQLFGDLGLNLFWHFLIVYNLYQLESFFFTYFFNAFNLNQSSGIVLQLKGIDWPMRTLLLLGLFLYRFKLIAWQREKKLPRWVSLTVIFYTGALMIFFFICMHNPALMPQSPHFTFWNIFIWPLNVWLIIELVRLLINNHQTLDPSQRQVTQSFAWFFLGNILIQMAILILSVLGQHFWTIPLSKALILYTNLFPLYWLKNFYTPCAGSLSKIINQNIDMTYMKKLYGLSDREFEILSLIVDGKSYKEIEALLFISIHTVKSHVYNLYRKMDINSRHQLIHKLSTVHPVVKKA